MNPYSKFSGVFSVLLTPFLSDGTIDEKGLRYTIQFLIAKGINGLVVLGSTGEFPYLTFEEKVNLMRIVADETQKKIPILSGTGCFGTDETIKLSMQAKEIGIDGLLLALPVYYPLKFKDVFKHFSSVAKSVDIPIIYYHFPENTHLSLSSKEIIKLLAIDNIVGVKESILNMKEIKTHITAMASIKKEFSFFSGTSLNLLSFFKMGGAGVICPIPNVLPEIVVKLYEAYKSKNIDTARQMQNKIFNFMPVFTGKSINPIFAKQGLKIGGQLGLPIKLGNVPPQAYFKEALRLLGHPITSVVRSPLPQITEKEKKLIQETLKKELLTK